MNQSLFGLPKVELHVHLEGTIRREILEKIGRRNNTLPVKETGAFLERIYRSGGDLSSFLRRFAAVCHHLRSPIDFYLAARDYGKQLSRQGVLYAEIHLSVQIFTRRGIPLQPILSAVDEAFEEAYRESGLMLRLILDGVRQWGPGSMLELVEMAEGTRRWKVVGIGLGGDENSFPAESFREAFRAARDRGWKTTVHAGEAGGPDSVRDAVEILKVDRIGHGVRAAGDSSVLDLLARSQIPIDLCPTSQRETGAVAKNGIYPLRTFLDRGIPVTIGSDDPALFQTDLTNELSWLQGHCGLSPEDLVRVERNGLEAIFCEPEVRRRLGAIFHAGIRSWQKNRTD